MQRVKILREMLQYFKYKFSDDSYKIIISNNTLIIKLQIFPM